MSARIPAVILAGGAGRRIGGDKAFVPLGARPLIAHVKARLGGRAGPIAVSANEPAARFEAFGLPVLRDGEMAGRGPLAGILAALNWAAEIGAPHVLTAPVDTPFLPRDLAHRLQGAIGSAPIALARSGARLHPTVGLWSVALRPTLSEALDRGTRKVLAFTAQVGAHCMTFPDAVPDPFFNVNTPEDLATAEAFLTRAT